jgi:hypothetical protein
MYSKLFNLSVSGPLLTVFTTSVPTGTVGLCYSVKLFAAGGTPPYQGWAYTGQLPPGIALATVSGAGLLSGTPSTTQGSPFNFGVTVKDNTGTTSQSRALSIPVNPGSSSVLPSREYLYLSGRAIAIENMQCTD